MVEKTRQSENIITITLLGSNRKMRIPNTQNRDDIPISLHSSDEFLYRRTPPHATVSGFTVTRSPSGVRSAAPMPRPTPNAKRNRRYRNLRFFLLWLVTSTAIYFALTNLPLTQ